MAESQLLLPSGLSQQSIEQVIAHLMLPTVDYADLYFQQTQAESWSLEEGIIKAGSFSIARGVGVRVISGEKTGFAYSDNLAMPALQDAATAATSIVQSGRAGRYCVRTCALPHLLYPTANPLVGVSEAEKVALLQKVDRIAREMDPRVQQVMASLVGAQAIILMVNSEGDWVADTRPLVRMSVHVIAESQGRREQGASGGGGRTSYDIFWQNNQAEQYAREAVRQALINLEAEPAPAGVMPVVLGPGWPGVLLHEAVGHGLEGDFNRKGSSAFASRLGEQVASPLCTIVDNGTLPGRRGSLNVDDEGTITQETVLIEKGRLVGYMQDRLNGRLMGTKSTGNARRESYAHMPIPRMTNTYLLPGESSPEEIIASVDKGIYVAQMSGGQVDITSGKFVFSTSEAYMIEGGRRTHPIKGATLIGNGPDVLTRVSMVGNDLALDSGVGICGKEGQQVPVGVGQPTLKVDDLVVGGTA